MHYQICEAKSATALMEKVRHLLEKGWKPTGGVAVANSNSTGGWWYYQALVHTQGEAVTMDGQANALSRTDRDFA